MILNVWQVFSEISTKNSNSLAYSYRDMAGIVSKQCHYLLPVKAFAIVVTIICCAIEYIN